MATTLWSPKGRLIHKLLIALALVTWLYPSQGKAQEVSVDPLVFYLQEGPGIREPIVIPPPEKKPVIKTKRLAKEPSAVPGEWGGSCVPFAKWYLGTGGTWGYGGRYLSANSPVALKSVILFGVSHVGVVIDFTSTQVLVLHSNGDYKGTVKLEWFDLNDSRIRGYHVF